jgi:hypothetical protein
LKKIPPFESHILPYLEIIRATPSKVFLVFGRGPWGYVDYVEDYLWQRYLYCAYLLAAGSHTLFKYHTSFQVTNLPGRSGGLDVYGDWGTDLGTPLGSYQQQGGLYLRHFTKALVLLIPHGGKRETYTLLRPMFTPEGKQLEETVVIEPGQGLLLLAEPPKPPQPIRRNFEPPHPTHTFWRWAEIRQELGGNHFLHVDRTPEGEEWEHDLMLEPVRTLAPKPSLRLRFRTNDTKAKLLLVAEVDDLQKRDRFVVVEVKHDTGAGQSLTVDKAVFFRGGTGRFTYVPAGLSFPIDGDWHFVALRGDQLLSKTKRYIFRRWSHVRFIGTIDIDDIEVMAN